MPARRRPTKPLVLILALLLSLAAIGCGKDEEERTPNEWDAMSWDEGSWE